MRWPPKGSSEVKVSVIYEGEHQFILSFNLFSLSPISTLAVCEPVNLPGCRPQNHGTGTDCETVSDLSSITVL